MSQRGSGHERMAFDEYTTPHWATLAVVPHLAPDLSILEPAAGTMQMVRALVGAGFEVVGEDIQHGQNFFARKETDATAIVTNPPYNLATEFLEHALELMRPRNGTVAMLLRTDFDHAKTRRHLFADHPAFDRKVVLTKRIVWFDRKGASPSFNHAWFVHRWGRNFGPPTLHYDFQPGKGNNDG